MTRGVIIKMIRCRDCIYQAEDWITGLNGHGLYRFNYCERLVHDLKIVEPEVERKCEGFRKKVAGRKESKGDVGD